MKVRVILKDKANYKIDKFDERASFGKKERKIRKLNNKNERKKEREKEKKKERTNPRVHVCLSIGLWETTAGI